MSRRGKRTDVLLAVAAFAVALAASLAFLHRYPPPEPKHDAALYYRIAKNVAAGKGFSADGVHPFAGVPPLFSSLLGAWFRFAGDSVRSGAVFQSLAHGGSAAAAYLLFRAMPCGLPLSFLLSLVVALQPMILTRVAFLLQEPVILLSTTASLAATVLWFRRKTGRWACAAGVLWGVASLAKAVALFAPPLAFVSRLAWDRKELRAAFSQSVLFVLAFLAVLAPWTARNYAAFHRLIPVSDQPGGALYEWSVSDPSFAADASGSGGAAAADRAGEGAWDRRIVASLEKTERFLGGFPAGRVARNAIDFAAPARDWWWSRGRYGPGEAREWYWTAHDVFHRFLFLFLLALACRTLGGKLAAPRGFVSLFCLLYWIEYSLVLGIPRYGVPLYPALLALLIPSPRTGREDRGGPVDP